MTNSLPIGMPIPHSDSSECLKRLFTRGKLAQNPDACGKSCLNQIRLRSRKEPSSRKGPLECCHFSMSLKESNEVNTQNKTKQKMKQEISGSRYTESVSRRKDNTFVPIHAGSLHGRLWPMRLENRLTPDPGSASALPQQQAALSTSPANADSKHSCACVH